MTNGLVVPADGSLPIERRELLDLSDYQALVGGWIEPVDVASVRATIYVNEEGLQRDLPLNARATFWWWFQVPAARQTQMLVGDAVVVGEADRAGNSTDLSRAVVEELLASGSFALEVDGRRLVGPSFDDYFEALVLAMVLEERSPGLTVRVRAD